MPRFRTLLKSPIYLTRVQLVWVVTGANLLFFHQPLWRYTASIVDLSSLGGWVVISLLVALLLALTWALLGTIALVSIRLLKTIAVLFFIINTIALYAMDSFNVVLDRAMMGNVWNTSWQESSTLFHPKLLWDLLLLAAVPSWLLWRVQVIQSARWKTLIHGGLVFFVSVLWIFIQSSSWLIIDQRMKVIGGLFLPWSYMVNSGRYFAQESRANQQLELLPSIAVNEAGDKTPVTVVLVIGESARAANFSLYGYGRNTNPKLAQRSIVALPHARSCSTYTTRSIECILSHLPEFKGLTHEVLPNYLERSGVVEVIWRSHNWGEPPLQVKKVLQGADLSSRCRAPDCVHADYDEALLAGLDEDLATLQHQRQLIVLHQAGSHGPNYHQKYPPDFARFTPACNSVDLKKCAAGQLVNAYDNTVVYTDHVLDRLIAILERHPERRTVMIYVSDHGESLGEGGWYLHGAPELVAPKEQLEIPFLVWTSKRFAQTHQIKPARLATKPNALDPLENQQGMIFHSVLGALGLSSPVYQAPYDIFERK